MLIKVMFLITLCIPVGYLQAYLLNDAIKDLKPSKKSSRPADTAYYHDGYFEREYMKLVK
ncbi:hypothetical protein HNQ80_004884 [Anaerosolibacter carboniphilus]|uniref:Uncharacterized protein n=1 Tax=Anaerosolibacter carboniphilus TaxID=1417629 RepID=A0A841L3G7_9FIRM|nr:hypothetical protein [Anaerosolibacter carboniphilus]MBB6218710.1 hypothetical protein [Anaerosolibacter carboniphilus]